MNPYFVVAAFNQEPIIQYIKDYLAPVDIFSLREVVKRCKLLGVCYNVLTRPFLKERVDKALSKKIKCLDVFIAGMKKTKTMISGGFMVAVIMGTEWKDTDIDMYTNNKLACLEFSFNADDAEERRDHSDALAYSGVLSTYLGEIMDCWAPGTKMYPNGSREDIDTLGGEDFAYTMANVNSEYMNQIVGNTFGTK